MTKQLRLIEGGRTDWRISDRTRRAGRRGVKRARQMLATAHIPQGPLTKAG